MTNTPNTVPTLEDYQKALQAKEELAKQVAERNEEIKRLKAEGKQGDTDTLRTLVAESVSVALKPVIDETFAVKKQNEELTRALQAQPLVSAVSSGGSESQVQPKSHWTPEQEAFFKAKGIDPAKVQSNIPR